MDAIELGQRFVKVSGPPLVWEASELVNDREGIRHFRLRNTSEPTTSILISERALLNPRYFRTADVQAIRRSFLSKFDALRTGKP
ncbi:MAG TPA: hypothetical protein VEJ16_07850 [Alphaproteobacteria bacterium]|jgi:hypothetical protein|nr:hypothetical protein [Alphaproteobacteria bacterium]